MCPDIWHRISFSAVHAHFCCCITHYAVNDICTVHVNTTSNFVLYTCTSLPVGFTIQDFILEKRFMFLSLCLCILSRTCLSMSSSSIDGMSSCTMHKPSKASFAMWSHRCSPSHKQTYRYRDLPSFPLHCSHMLTHQLCPNIPHRCRCT